MTQVKPLHKEKGVLEMLYEYRALHMPRKTYVKNVLQIPIRVIENKGGTLEIKK